MQNPEDKTRAFTALADDVSENEQRPVLSSQTSNCFRFCVCAILTGSIAIIIALTITLAIQQEETAVYIGETDASPTRSPVEAVPADAAFNIQLEFLDSAGSVERAVFSEAVSILQSVIVEDIATSAVLRTDSVVCDVKTKQSVEIDDILVYVSFRDIDGPNGVFAQAGPCGFDDAGRIRVGKVEIDSSDFASLISSGRACRTVLHELLHVLGFGAVWMSKELVDGSFRYQGPQGNLGNTEIGRHGQALVENSDAGVGAAGGHWRESVYGSELMTGFIGEQNSPMSRLTVRALADLGYSVDVTKADIFTVQSTRRRRLRQKTTERLPYKNDVIEFERTLIETVPKVTRKRRET